MKPNLYVEPRLVIAVKKKQEIKRYMLWYVIRVPNERQDGVHVLGCLLALISFLSVNYYEQNVLVWRCVQ